MKKFLIISFAIYLCHLAYGQGRIVEDFTQVFDTLAVQIEERTGVKGEIKANAVMKRGNSLDFYFTETLSDFPWRKRDIKWLRTSLKAIFPEEYKKYRLGEIYSRKVNFEKLVMPEITYNGMPAASSHRKRKPSTPVIFSPLAFSILRNAATMAAPTSSVTSRTSFQ